MVISPASISTDSKGSFFVSFEVPASLPGVNSVQAGDTSQSARAEFTSVLTATISQITSKEAPGHVGMHLTVNGAGFTPNARVMVTRATVQETLANAETDAQGVFLIDFTIPPSPSGEHHIIVTDGVNTKQFELFLEQEPPLSPFLLQPDTEKRAKQPVTFDWKDISDPSGVTYTLQIAKDEQFATVFLEKEGLADSQFTVPGDELGPVIKDTPYYLAGESRGWRL